MPVHEKILRGGKEKAKYCYLTFSMIFHFSAIIFHVDSCESYATLDQDERQKSGGYGYNLLLAVLTNDSRLVKPTNLPNKSTIAYKTLKCGR